MRVFFTLFFLVSLPFLSAAQQVQIPFDFSGSQILIRATLGDNSKDTLTFIFDTGATGINLDASLVEKLHLKPDTGQVTMGGGAEMFRAATVSNQTLHFGSFSLEKQQVKVLPLGALTANVPRTVDGVIGYPLFKDRKVEVNLDKNMLIVYPMNAAVKEFSQVKGIPYTFDKSIRIPQIKASYTLENGKKMTGIFFFDTGARLALRFSPSYSLANKLREQAGNATLGRFGPPFMGGKDGGDYDAILKNIQLGTHTLNLTKLPVELFGHGVGLSGVEGFAGILGSAILYQFNILLDDSKKLIYLKTNAYTNQPTLPFLGINKTLNRANPRPDEKLVQVYGDLSRFPPKMAQEFAQSDTLFMQYNLKGKQKTMYTAIKDGKFYFEAFLSEPSYVLFGRLLNLPAEDGESGERLNRTNFETMRSFFLVPGTKVQIKSDNGSLQGSKITGGDERLNAEYDKLYRATITTDYYPQEQALADKAFKNLDIDYSAFLKEQKRNDSLLARAKSRQEDTTQFFAQKNRLNQRGIAYDNKTNNIYQVRQMLDEKQNKMINQALKQFAYDHPSSPIALYALSKYMAAHGPAMPADTVQQIYAAFSDELKKSASGRDLAALIKEKLSRSIGAIAPDFSSPDASGKPIALSSFRGKYVLLDFWASWCGPCRRENPNVRAAYVKFKDKGFEVFSVSIDEKSDSQKWQDAVKQDQMTWTNAIDYERKPSSPSILYSTNAIPMNFLIDPNGKIVATNLRGAELAGKLEEILKDKR